jgi:hypothetical protein
LADCSLLADFLKLQKQPNFFATIIQDKCCVLIFTKTGLDFLVDVLQTHLVTLLGVEKSNISM